MRTIVAVTTTLRAGSDYLPATIEQLEEAGAKSLRTADKLLYSDGPLVHRPAGWTIIESPAAQGSRAAFWEVLRMVYHQHDVDLVAFEDDLLACRNAVTAMINFEVPQDLAFVSFFDNITPAGAPPGMRRYVFGGAQDFWGAQAIKIPHRSLKYLVDAKESAFPKPREGRHQGRDVAMQLCFMNSPLKQWGTWFPHFLQHVGDESVVNSTRALRIAAAGEKRDSKNWPGPGFDALISSPSPSESAPS